MAKKEKIEELKKDLEETSNSVNKIPSIDSPGVKCDAVEPNSVAYNQLVHYASRPKVSTRLMRGAGEKPGSFETVIVNDLRINILKGMPVKLPDEVAAIIDDAFYRTDQAINQTKIKNPFTGAKKPAVIDQQSEEDRSNY